jgi:RND family efflux transporter MFP subunit
VTTYPGATVDVGAELGGRITRLFVQEEQHVHRGEVIAELSSDEQRAALAEAKARVEETGTNITFLTTELARMTTLAKTASVSRQSVDKAARDLDAARAQRDVAIAAVAQLDAQVAKLRVVSPIDGVVIARYVEPGETVGPGTRLVTVSDLTRRRIEAEVDEFDAGRIVKGAPVQITAEGYDGQSWSGIVDVVPAVVVARALKPQDPSRPSDTRVLLIKITLPANAPLKLGQRVEVSVAPRH